MAAKSSSASRIITGIFSHSQTAAEALATLINSGFEERTLSVIGADCDQVGAISAHLQRTKPDLALIMGSIFGAIFGAICGWLSIEYIPATKYFSSVLPLMAAFVGAAAGAFLGLLIDRMPEPFAPSEAVATKPFLVKRGILVSVFVKDTASRFKAESVLQKCGAEEILVVRTEEEASSPNAA